MNDGEGEKPAVIKLQPPPPPTDAEIEAILSERDLWLAARIQDGR